MSLPTDTPWPRSPHLRFGAQRTPTHRHQGVDLAAPTGTPVRAIAAGRVVVALRTPASSSARWRGRGYGRHVVLDHGNGTWSLYAHLDQVDVNDGDELDEGAQLGRVGRTLFDPARPAALTRAPHLHFEVLERFPPRREADRVDPEAYFRARGTEIPFRTRLLSRSRTARAA
jgi:murein DD-endopeptidase MepM/ murein hydrolase activator NlpD